MVGAVLLLGCARTHPPAPDGQHPTGLRAPNAAERAWTQNLPATGEVRFNALGLERANAERARQGLPPLSDSAVPTGHEVTPRPTP